MAWYNDVWDFAKENALELAKMGGAGAKAYIDIKDQKRRNELEEAAYRNYMSNVEAAGKEAQAAIDLNLMPMEISNVPTSKADVSDFTAVAARGGLMNLPTRQRKRYAIGTEQEDIEIMEPESLGDFELKQEEGVNIGPMAGFPDTGDPMSNAQQVWQSGAIDQGIYQMDFNIFFQSGDWMDYISKEEVQGDMQMAKGNFNNPPYQPTQGAQDAAIQEIMAAQGGIIGLRNGGRPGYAEDGFVTADVEEVVSEVSPERKNQIEGNQMSEDAYNEIFQKFIEKFPGIATGEETLAEMVAMLQAEGVMETEDLGILGLDRSIDMITPQSVSKDVQRISRGDTQYGNVPEELFAQGGRIGYAQGSGIMNLGGLEKDYRTTGGFVPIGGRERADDVPARLSKNEFVMTADAVRAAGGGSINKGAQRMYDTMKHLEASPTAKRMTA